MKNDENDEKVDIVKMPEFGVLEQASEKIGKNLSIQQINFSLNI